MPPSTPATATTHFLLAACPPFATCPQVAGEQVASPRVLRLHELQGDHRGWGRLTQPWCSTPPSTGKMVAPVPPSPTRVAEREEAQCGSGRRTAGVSVH